jgi:prolyl-tRNA editing enzyme YbaK/EbsC (Cys-tRNA(Pro) deacylase)
VDFGSLRFEPATDHLDLVAAPVGRAMQAIDAAEIRVAAIDPSVADTAAFCERYAVGLEQGANCVVIEARRGDTVRYAACMIRSSDRIDVNGTVRRHLDAKKASFAAREATTSATGMEYGGITPLGLPGGWPLLVDVAVASAEWLVIGSGLRESKLLVPGRLLACLPGAEVMPIAKRPDPRP